MLIVTVLYLMHINLNKMQAAVSNPAKNHFTHFPLYFFKKPFFCLHYCWKLKIPQGKTAYFTPLSGRLIFQTLFWFGLENTLTHQQFSPLLSPEINKMFQHLSSLVSSFPLYLRKLALKLIGTSPPINLPLSFLDVMLAQWIRIASPGSLSHEWSPWTQNT